MTCVLKAGFDKKKSEVTFKIPSSLIEKVEAILGVCESKFHGYVSVRLDKPRRPRTTGDLSQNNLVWKLISAIAEYIGDDSPGMTDTENEIKRRAVGRGYPTRVNKVTGGLEPLSMTKIDTVQCGYLIDTAYQVAAELGIVLPPRS